MLDLHGIDTCFSVRCSFLPGFFVFVSSAITYFILSTVVLRISQARMNEIEDACTSRHHSPGDLENAQPAEREIFSQQRDTVNDSPAIEDPDPDYK